MTIKSQSLAIVAFMLLFASIGIAGSSQAQSPSRDIDARNPKQLVNDHDTRRDAVTQEYEARVVEFKAGRSPVNVVLQANQKLLRSSLAADSPNAAINYDRRAAEIEAFAQKRLELGVGVKQEVAQARFARLDNLIKSLLIRPSSRNN